jgi:hypothetical protein
MRGKPTCLLFCVGILSYLTLTVILLITLQFALAVWATVVFGILCMSGLSLAVAEDKGQKAAESMLSAKNARELSDNPVRLTTTEIEEAIKAAIKKKQVEVVFKNRYLSYNDEFVIKNRGYTVEHFTVEYNSDKPRDHLIKINWVNNAREYYNPL